jgi:hypothetical protein
MGRSAVTLRALLLLGGMSLALASAASAQFVSPPIPPSPAAIGPPPADDLAAGQPGLPPQRITAMMRARGFRPVGAPARRGNLYVQRALDPDEMEYRLLIDALTGRTVSIEPMRMAGPYAYGPRPYAPSPYRPPHYWGRPPDSDGFGYGVPRPPHSVPSARLAPPQAEPPQTQPAHIESQPTPSAQAPLPRPKPYVMEATGSIPVGAPASPAPQKMPAPAPSAPQKNGAVTLPPVAPLD